MITAIVQFKLPEGISRAQAAALFNQSAPKYRNLPGLVRKYYLYGEDGAAGGVYLWESRAAAEKVYDAAWRRMLTERYGAAPTVTYFETPVIVDNLTGKIETEAAA
jgi:hypothetical protein